MAEVKAKRIRRKKPLTYEEVVSKYCKTYGPLIGKGMYKVHATGGTFKGAAVGTSPAYGYCVQAAEVKIDEETGEIEVQSFYDIHDCGQPINPTLIKGQVHGALYMGMAESIWEEVKFDPKNRRLLESLPGRVLVAHGAGYA